MKKNGFWGVLVILLVFGFIGCGGNGTDDNKFTVTFDLEGGNISGNTASVKITVKSGDNIANLPSPKKEYIFNGWFTQKNGLGNEFTQNSIVTSDLTVYASWVSIPSELIGTWEGISTGSSYDMKFTVIISKNSIFRNASYWKDGEIYDIGNSGGIWSEYVLDVLSFSCASATPENYPSYDAFKDKFDINEYPSLYTLNGKVESRIGFNVPIGYSISSFILLNDDKDKMYGGVLFSWGSAFLSKQ